MPSFHFELAGWPKEKRLRGQADRLCTLLNGLQNASMFAPEWNYPIGRTLNSTGATDMRCSKPQAIRNKLDLSDRVQVRLVRKRLSFGLQYLQAD